MLPTDTYRVADINSHEGTIYATTAHVSQLKSWKVTTDDSEEEELLSDEPLEDEKEKDDSPEESLSQSKSLNTRALTEQNRPIRRHQVPKHLTDYAL